MATAPVLRAPEVTLPETPASGPSVTLGSGISSGAKREIHRVTLAHEHFADIGNIAGGTDGKRAAIAVLAVRSARNPAFGHELSEPFSRCPSAWPFAALCVAAGLVKLRSVYADQPDLFTARLQRVAVDYLHAGHRYSRRVWLMPKPEGFCSDGDRDDQNAEKQNDVRRTQTAYAPRIGRGPPRGRSQRKLWTVPMPEG